MRFWFSCFPLAPAVKDRLALAGLEPAQGQGQSPDGLLLLYDTPDNLVTCLEGENGIATLIHQYRLLSEQVRAGATALAIHRAMAIPAQALADWLDDGRPAASPPGLPDPAPISAVIASVVLERQPSLLEAYLDLELQAELLGGAVDAQYLERLRGVIGAVNPDQLLQQWQAPWQTARQLRHRLQASDQRLAQQQAERAALERCERDCAELRRRLDDQASLAQDLQDAEQQLREAHRDLEQSFLTCERLLDLGRQCRVALGRAERLLTQSR